MDIENRKVWDPYIDVDFRHTRSTKKKSKKKYRERRVYKRNVFLSIVYTILTFGIYGIFWQFEIAKESNALSKNEKGFCPALVVFFTIITCGIYGVYWGYQVGKKHNQFYEKHGQPEKSFNVVYLLLLLFNYLCPILNLICYAIMQAKVNAMLRIEDEYNPRGLYVRDSSIFNRPLWSTIILLLICETIPGYFLSFFERIFVGAPGNPATPIVGNYTNAAIQNSVDQIVYADTSFMLAHSILNILLIVGVLWWFKLRFKHANYEGVMVLRNFGRACLLMLPGILFIGINLFGINFDNFKIGIVLLGFVPGFVEEITFRGMIIPNLMRIYNRSKGIWLSLFVTALIFGLIHAANIFVGADPGTTVFQVCYAFAMGILFAGVFIRTGNIWPLIICHGLVDAVAMMADEALQQGAVQTQEFVFDLSILPLCVVSLFFIFFGIFICRRSKHKEICELWSEKWGDAVC